MQPAPRAPGPSADLIAAARVWYTTVRLMTRAGRTTRLFIVALAFIGSIGINRVGSSVLMAARQDSRSVSGQERSVWDGVYTEEQSRRGERTYSDSCATCHAADLTGSQVVPALVGADFLTKLNGSMLSDLFDRIRTTMPQDGPGSLSSAQYADVVAFMLNKNNFPAGTADLPADIDALKTIHIEPSKKH
jgi:mono/diheme cytochrome c family protein